MKEILRIIIGNLLITAAYAFITVPRHVVNGGVTSFSMILHTMIPMDISVITNVVTLLLLVVCLMFLGKAFLVKSLLSSLCYMVFFTLFHSWQYVLPLPLLPAILLAAVAVGYGYYLNLSSGSSTVGFDVLALVLHQRDPCYDVAFTMRIINIVVIFLGVTSYGIPSVLIGILFTFIQTQILHTLLKSDAQRAKIQGAQSELESVSKCIVNS